MRFISKLTIAVAAIFFALSVSAHAGGHDTTSTSIGSKIYQVCKKWRVDQGGWMATDKMQHCRNVLLCASRRDYEICDTSVQCNGGGFSNCNASDVDTDARDRAKACIKNDVCASY